MFSPFATWQCSWLITVSTTGVLTGRIEQWWRILSFWTFEPFQRIIIFAQKLHQLGSLKWKINFPDFCALLSGKHFSLLKLRFPLAAFHSTQWCSRVERKTPFFIPRHCVIIFILNSIVEWNLALLENKFDPSNWMNGSEAEDEEFFHFFMP